MDVLGVLSIRLTFGGGKLVVSYVVKNGDRKMG